MNIIIINILIKFIVNKFKKIMSFQKNQNNHLRENSFISPSTHSKINISNLIAETQRLLTNSYSNKITESQNTQINSPKLYIKSKKENQFLDLYKSYSTNRVNFIKNKKENKKNKIVKNISNKKNEIKIKKNSLSPSEMLTKFANVATQLNKSKIINSNTSLMGKKPNIIINKRNPNSNIDIRYARNTFFTSNNSVTNIYNNTNENNLINFSSNTSFIQNNNNIEQKKERELRNFKKEINITNIELNDNNIYNHPLSQSSSYNNSDDYIQQFYKKVNNYKNKDRNLKNNNKKNVIQSQTHQSEISQNFITTNQSTIKKKKIKNSQNSSLTEGKYMCNINKNEYISNFIGNINIDTPEELHFFYINIFQKGKEFEKKFELINP